MAAPDQSKNNLEKGDFSGSSLDVDWPGIRRLVRRVEKRVLQKPNLSGSRISIVEISP
jgi:hypothetical protein